MPIKVIPIAAGFPSSPYEKDDCIALRMYGKDALSIDMSFPFHEDTPNFRLSISEAMDLKNAIDQLIDIKLIEKPKEEK